MEEQIAAWYRRQQPDAADVVVRLGAPLSQGYSNRVVVAEVSLRVDRQQVEESVVVRLPPDGPPLFPDASLEAQVAAQARAGEAGVPVAQPIVLEDDPTWLGAPFLVMPLVRGRHPGEVPAMTDWLVAAGETTQRQVQTGMLDALVALHRAPCGDLPVPRRSIADEIGWWEAFARWACEDRTPSLLLDLLARCRDTAPADEPPPSLLWGDVRLGNVVVDEDDSPAALLDWEMTTIGPAESDVAWYTALSDLTDHFAGTRVPGFLDRDGVVAHVEARLGRQLQDLAWHESFAIVRSAAASLRTRVVKALVEGQELPDPDQDFRVRHAADHLETA